MLYTDCPSGRTTAVAGYVSFAQITCFLFFVFVLHLTVSGRPSSFCRKEQVLPQGCLVKKTISYVLNVKCCVIFAGRSATRDSLLRLLLSVDELQVWSQFDCFKQQFIDFYVTHNS